MCSVIIPLLPYFRQAHFYLTGAPPLCVPAFLAPGAPPGNPPPPASSPGWACCRAGSPGPPVVPPVLTSVLPYVRLAEAEPWCWPGLGLSPPVSAQSPSLCPGVGCAVQELRSGLRCARSPAPPAPGLGELWELRRALNSAETGAPNPS